MFLELSRQVEAAAFAKVQELNSITRLEVDKRRTLLHLGVVIWDRVVNNVTYVNCFSQLASVSVVMVSATCPAPRSIVNIFTLAIVDLFL